MHTTGEIHKIFTKVEGNEGCLNDVIVFKANRENFVPKCNLIYFGGDIQDYFEEMNKSWNSRDFSEWNLIKTGNILYEKFASKENTVANIFIIRADFFHLRSFANYSNFVPSTDFGVPLEEATQPKSGSKDESSNSESNLNAVKTSYFYKLRCWLHLMKLFENSIGKYNANLNQVDQAIVSNLPIVISGFSKGCIVLNELCNELEFMESASVDEFMSAVKLAELTNFLYYVKHFIWLDGGHSGMSNGWIIRPKIIKLMKQYNFFCYVYVTPYQIMSRKYWAVEEYKKFVQLLGEFELKFKNKYYFEEKEEEFDINVHFAILELFDSSLIE